MPARTSIILAIAFVLAFATLALVTRLLSGSEAGSSFVWAIAGAVSILCLTILATGKYGRRCNQEKCQSRTVG